MFAPFALLANFASEALLILASPAQAPLDPPLRLGHARFFDVQAHRGGRGNTVENTLPSFAWGLIDGASTLELDNGITKDGVVIVWHDEEITPAKCTDTAPVTPDDPDFPYVGKYIANLTLAQIKTLDCGAKRQYGYPMQLTYPGTRISTLQEVFDFAECADPTHQILWNIESKIDAEHPEKTKSVQDFVQKQNAIFSASPYVSSITYQSFDWRTLIAMKTVNPSILTSALIDNDTAIMSDNSTSPWLGGLRLDAFPGPTAAAQVAQAAYSIGADILSPAAESSSTPVPDPDMPGYITFTTRDMIEEAHRLGMLVKVWTVNRMNIVDQILDWKVDGIITDYPNVVRRVVKHRGLPAAPKYPKQRVLSSHEKSHHHPPTVRTLPSGLPSASFINLAARAPAGHGHEHGHGAAGPRSDVPPKWAGSVSRSSTLGLVSRTLVTAPTTGVFQNRLLHTSAVARDAPQVPDFSHYEAKSPDTNRGLAYLMIGSLGVLSASMAKSTVTEFLSTMAASADVLAMAKVELDLASIPEGKNVVIKWRGKPVFIRHRTQGEIAEARSEDWKSMRDPESDESRTKKPEWLVMLGVCTHLGCVPIGEAGDYGGWFCPCHGSHYDISGRIRKGPAPLNLEVPVHDFNDAEGKLVIG
ncbi:Cytochrome b-c1 complex subunit Rieske, mitochondrial [Grifola frondosa]|uniref:Cytochrome b-c1 complex subunit Rieske, mitochondrial n=1 Tax=Grifola frondosa TaxID=5627 RepID=A0A1C7MW11_GRIFR|nr:Cytochrome b-c1 complex subunit Rieske, mitochondrial [Grifola frondosa]